MRPLPDLSATLPAARALHERLPVIDAHADILWRVLQTGADFVSGAGCHHVCLDALLAVGGRVQGMSLFTESRYTGATARDRVYAMLDRLDAMLTEAPDRLVRIGTRGELAACLNAGEPRLGVVPWLEGGSALMGELAVTDALIARGLRGVTLTHNHGCEIADGCAVAEPKGLTAFGRALIPHLQARGVIVDLAHVPPPGFWEVVARAERPLAVSHSGNFEAWANPRNLDERQVEAIAASGGVIGIDFYAGHLTTPDFDGRRRASVADVACAIARIVRIAGEDHVGLGSDFDGYGTDCVGLETARELPNLTAMLLGEGYAYSESRVAKILGGNWRRLLDACLPA